MSDENKPGEAAELDAGVAPEAQPETELTVEELIIRLEAEKADMNGQILRLLADLDNTRKRADRQVSEARIYAIEKFAADLLSVSDNLSRALDALPDSERENLTDAGKNLLGGIEMTAKELNTALSRHGVVPVPAEPGAVFDPNVHQAVAQIPSPQPSGTIAQLFQPGWKIGDRTLRAAMVAVSTGPAN
ncbi:co-chaperone GrpE [Hyphomonas neptunium ATCC 15444]|uniref:Protein GrpE n=2 Tax=Hyphomonas TaxID=85 RepID=GRPE_HYPNA|nr:MULTISPECIES: nucleotide exchange factor GrpE [Hyphomonas]Q0BX02.1 RecName: Full=Protein GrpE; AltName: Full=HSP-70 cofactor [Hyphomonas neptunium ATCC 15444]ABI75635.1 co-chaperone GrpE [Hyphomonas neptunium ATCC 15444]KCZ92009.1 co-chaperone GrpE [Hyphomonas hirschiana VP5]